MATKTSPKKQHVVLTRTRADDARWVLRSGWFRAITATTVLAVTVATGVWQWPTIKDMILPDSASPTTTSVPYISLGWDAGLSDTSTSTVSRLRTDLSKAIGAADTLIDTKIADGVDKKKTEATQNAVDDATVLLDKHVRFTTPLSSALDRLKSETSKLTKVKPPKSDPAPPSDGGGGGGDSTPPSGGGGGGGSTPPGGGGGNDSPPRGGGRASSSASITCSGSNVTVVFTARGGGTVNVTVSGPASGSNSGSGSATVSVSGPGGTYTASASASGTVSVSGRCR